MITLLLHLLRLLPLLFGGPRQLALENLALRQQLVVYTRTVPRPRLRTTDRVLWVGLATVWAGWRQALVIVSPNTVLRWHRRRFREHWTGLSGRPRLGRPPISAETAALIRRMAVTNPLWGAPRIHGELLKLGIDLAERTVSRLLSKRRPLPSQTWRTFLTNHIGDLVSIDFFTVPTAHLHVVLRQNSVRREVVDLPALIRRRSWFDDHPPAPAASPPALSLRRPPPARPREPRLAPAARRLQANGAPTEATHD